MPAAYYTRMAFAMTLQWRDRLHHPDFVMHLARALRREHARRIRAGIRKAKEGR